MNENKKDYLKSMFDYKIILIVRADNEKIVNNLVEAAIKGGVKIIEITMTVPNAIETIQLINKNFGKSIIVGAGTVLDAITARLAILAGAQFIVSPCINFETIKICQKYSKIVMAGAMTPNEVLSAWEAGSDIVKIFPINILGGSNYIKILKGPFPQILLNPSGSIDLDEANSLLKAGASVVSIGSAILDKNAIENNQYSVITKKAEKFTKLIN